MAVWMQVRSFGTGDEGLSNTTVIIIIVFLSLSLYNVVELTAVILGTFKRYAGVYFWSFVAATLGITLSCAGFLIKYFGATSLAYLSCTLGLIGWVLMVTGQSMVLWSRLHLVLQGQRRLKIVFWIIIIDAIVCHGSVIPMVYGSYSSTAPIWKKPYVIAEKIEIVVFFLQETLLSSLYIIETVKLMRQGYYMGNNKLGRVLMKHLILVNLVVILLDITILSLEFAHQYDIQITYKPFVYSVKLKVEFTILNRLVAITTRPKGNSFVLRSGKIPKTGVPLETTTSEADSKPTGDVSCQPCDMECGEGSNDRGF